MKKCLLSTFHSPFGIRQVGRFAFVADSLIHNHQNINIKTDPLLGTGLFLFAPISNGNNGSTTAPGAAVPALLSAAMEKNVRPTILCAVG
jgi:hypothetical protein